MSLLKSPEDLLLFSPVPVTRKTAGGWTSERQRAFILALASTGVVKAAADSVGMSARSAYALRDRAAAKANRLVDAPMTAEQAAALGPGYIFSFAAAWDLALSHGIQLQMEAALPDAIEKERVPIVRRGRIIGWQRKFNARLANNALGAWRRHYEGVDFDHEQRIAARTLHLAETLETLWKKGPPRWPEKPFNSDLLIGPLPPERRDGFYADGEVRNGLLDPDGPADQPPRRWDARKGGRPPVGKKPPKMRPMPQVRPL